MTQVTQNEKTLPVILNYGRVRTWCFTHNNYKEDDIKKYQSLDCDYLFQEETGANGTKHLQGVLLYKNAVSFNSLKKQFPQTHWEPAKNKIASIRYCCKESTRTGAIYHSFDYSKYCTNGTAQNDKVEKISGEQIKKLKKKEERWKFYEAHYKELLSLGVNEETAHHSACRLAIKHYGIFDEDMIDGKDAYHSKDEITIKYYGLYGTNEDKILRYI